MTAPLQHPGLHWDVHAGTGEHLLLVHGFVSSRTQWLPNLDALRRVARPVVVELYGHGRSPSPDDRNAYTAAAYAEQFEAIREAVGADRWIVAGHSLGTALALHYVLAKPGSVLGHVMTNSNSAVADAAWFEGRREQQAEMARSLESAAPGDIVTSPFFPGRVRGLTPDVVAAFEADAGLHSPIGLARSVRYTTPTTSSRDLVSTNTVPTLLVAGRRERAFDESREFLAATMPGIEVVDVDAAHAVNLEAPAAFDAAVADFVCQLR